MIKENISLFPYNTFKIDVSARYFASYATQDELTTILRNEICKEFPLLHIGAGSNLLFLDNFNGLVLFSEIQFFKNVTSEINSDDDDCENNVFVEVGAGVKWDDFVEYCVSKNYYGAENLSNIPGQVGASAIQNIGAYGVEASTIIHAVNCIEVKTGQQYSFKNHELQFGYRMSRFKNEWQGKYIVTSVVYRLSKRKHFYLFYSDLEDVVRQKGELTLQNVRDSIIEIRNAKLPNPEILGNAGSFFMNPIVDNNKFAALKKHYERIPHYVITEKEIKIPAAWLIEKAGLKGKIFRGAGVHEMQPLVLVNYGTARGKDILHLADKIRKRVNIIFGIDLNLEVIVIKKTSK